MHLPEAVAQQRGPVREIGMAVGLALRPVADVVLAYHAIRAGHTDQRAEVDEHLLQPVRAVERAMDEAPVHAQRVAEADRDGCGRRGTARTLPTSPVSGPAISAVNVMTVIQSDFTGFQHDVPGDGVGIIGLGHARRPERAGGVLQGRRR